MYKPLPWFKNPADFRLNNPAFRNCSEGTRAFIGDIQEIAHSKHQPSHRRGYLDLSAERIAEILDMPTAKAVEHLAEALSAGVLPVTEKGVPYFPQTVQDEAKHALRRGTIEQRTARRLELTKDRNRRYRERLKSERETQRDAHARRTFTPNETHMRDAVKSLPKRALRTRDAVRDAHADMTDMKREENTVVANTVVPLLDGSPSGKPSLLSESPSENFPAASAASADALSSSVREGRKRKPKTAASNAVEKKQGDSNPAIGAEQKKLFEGYNQEFKKRFGLPYRSTTADFVQLTRLLKAAPIATDYWERACVNFLDSPLGKYSLADLASRVEVFARDRLDQYGKPANALFIANMATVDRWITQCEEREALNANN